MEEWKPIKEYEGLYEVSSYGRIKSLIGQYGKQREKILKNNKQKNGYIHITLSKNGKLKTYSIHRLVAETFIPNPNNLPIINHKDENPSNNKVENLEWCTYKYNNNYGTRNERLSNSLKGRTFNEDWINKMKINHTNVSGKNNPRARKVECITTGKIFNCIKEASEFYNINRQHISSCCKGKIKTSGKLKDGTPLEWKYWDGD